MSAHPILRPFGRRAHPARSQRGAVLIVALILLAVLTLLGVTAMSTTSLEEKMAANTQEGTRAFQIAETGLATGF
nr:PilX N-terminal domain-containing pilus assembly protein [Gammaproteobacteria bacterium]